KRFPPMPATAAPINPVVVPSIVRRLMRPNGCCDDRFDMATLSLKSSDPSLVPQWIMINGGVSPLSADVVANVSDWLIRARETNWRREILSRAYKRRVSMRADNAAGCWRRLG